jgi:hypothetical protein
MICAIALAMAGCRGSDSHLTVQSGGRNDALASTTVSSETTTAPPETTVTKAVAPPVTGTTATTAQLPVTTTPPQPAPATTGRWKVVDSGPLVTRGEPKAVWTGHEVIVVGGLVIDQYQALSDGAAFDPARGTWRRIANRPVPGRVLHATWTGTEVFTLGSNRIDLDPITNASAYNPSTDTWRQVPLPPSTKSPHAVVWTGTRVLVWQPGEPAPGALYDPGSDRWTAIPANTVPGAASAGAAVWTGDTLAIEGAVTPAYGGPVEQRLFLFDPAKLTWRVSSRLPSELSTWPYLFGGATSGQVVIVGPSAASPSGSGTTLVYDLASDRWRSLPAPFGNAQAAAEGLDSGVLAFGTGPLHLLDVKAATWSDSDRPPGPLVGDGVLVSTGCQAFVFGITTNGSYVEARQPNAAYVWTP